MRMKRSGVGFLFQDAEEAVGPHFFSEDEEALFQ